MRRREFIALLGGAACNWSLAARAQQPAMPVVGFLVSASPQGTYIESIAAVRQGLNDAGFVDGRNLTNEYRWAENQYERLPSQAADLVQRKVNAIFATGSVTSAVVAKAATKTIPIVFANGSDPVQYDLVASLSRPGGNITGVTFLNSGLGPKRLELLHELVPKSAVIAFLVNPNNPNAKPDSEEMVAAARTIGVRALVVEVGTERDFDAGFARINQERADALMVSNDALFQSRIEKIVALAARYALPAMYAGREFIAGGGLIGYATDIPDMYRQVGSYVGRILKGEKPAELPVLQPTKFELAINLRTAKAPGLMVPESFLLRADEVIE